MGGSIPQAIACCSACFCPVKGIFGPISAHFPNCPKIFVHMLFSTVLCRMFAAPLFLGEGREGLCSSGWVLVQLWGWGFSFLCLLSHCSPIPLCYLFQVLISTGLWLGMVGVVKYRVWDCSVGSCGDDWAGANLPWPLPALLECLAKLPGPPP